LGAGKAPVHVFWLGDTGVLEALRMTFQWEDPEE
jgi:hypothetical protein